MHSFFKHDKASHNISPRRPHPIHPNKAIPANKQIVMLHQAVLKQMYVFFPKNRTNSRHHPHIIILNYQYVLKSSNICFIIIPFFSDVTIDVISTLMFLSFSLNLPSSNHPSPKPSNQWEFQDPKMEVLYHIRPYETLRPSIYNRGW